MNVITITIAIAGLAGLIYWVDRPLVTKNRGAFAIAIALAWGSLILNLPA